MNTKLLFIQALSPLHSGTGQGVGVIDLPIAREKSTGIPFLPGASIKGVLRDSIPKKVITEKNEQGEERTKEEDSDLCKAIFGAAELENAGAAVFADARLLLIPIRSLAGTFAYVTSPYLLKRLARDANSAEITGLPEIPVFDNLEECAIVKTDDQTTVLDLSCITINIANNIKVVLEDIDLNPAKDASLWADWLAINAFSPNWQGFFKARLCIVHDDILAFMLETATEVNARIQLNNDTKTVANLWYEESRSLRLATK
jgi:CRISPR-associated protein Cmr4